MKADATVWGRVASSNSSVPRCFITSRSDGYADGDRDQSLPTLIRLVRCPERKPTAEHTGGGPRYISRYALDFENTLGPEAHLCAELRLLNLSLWFERTNDICRPIVHHCMQSLYVEVTSINGHHQLYLTSSPVINGTLGSLFIGPPALEAASSKGQLTHTQ